jgi:hypothetical protein
MTIAREHRIIVSMVTLRALTGKAFGVKSVFGMRRA